MELFDGVAQLRLIVTVADYETALSFYRDTLGMPVEASLDTPNSHGVILSAGRATLELADQAHAAYVDEVEVGQRVAGHIRVALEVADSTRGTQAAVGAGATLIAEPTRTPWNSLNSRLTGPDGLQLTLFQEL